MSKPVELMKCKPAASKQEVKAREAAETQNLSDHEVLGRLIYAETLATGYFAQKCNAESVESLMNAIGWVVMNRVDKYSPKRDDPKPDAIFHVVFQPKQFSTAFTSKNSNPFARAFLCPLEGEKYLKEVKSEKEAFELYSRAKEVAARILDKYQRNGIDVLHSKITNFYFPHSDLAGEERPAWAKNADPTKNKGFVRVIDGEKPCAELYKR